MSKILEASAAGRRRLIVLAAAALLLFAGVGTYLARGDDQDPELASVAVHPVEQSPVQLEVSPQPAGETALRPIATSDDPEGFAVSAATALFEWDTTTMTQPTEYADRLVAVADPTGEESAGLVADIANYLPTPGAWASLRQYGTRQ